MDTIDAKTEMKQTVQDMIKAEDQRRKSYAAYKKKEDKLNSDIKKIRQQAIYMGIVE